MHNFSLQISEEPKKKQLTFDEVRLVKDSDQGKKIEQINESQLPYPSLNEIAYTAFGDSSIEYHNELYSYIESEGWKHDFEEGKPRLPYNKITKVGTRIEQLIKTEIIRHQIHHPENNLNAHFTKEELSNSIDEMRSFIETYKAANK